MTTEVSIINPTEYGLDEKKASELTANLPQIKAEREVLVPMYDEVLKMDIEDPATAKKAKEVRLKIRDNRTKGIEVWHKNSKDFFLKGGQFVDAIKRQEVAINQRMEENLEAIEKHFENMEKKRISDLNEARKALLAPFVESVENLDLGTMAYDVWEAYYSAKEKAYNERIAAEKAAEEARIEAEKEATRKRAWEIKFAPIFEFAEGVDLSLSDKELEVIFLKATDKKKEHEAEHQRIREENERLRKQQEEAESEARKTREAAEKAEKERIAAEKKAARAPDKEKLQTVKGLLQSIQLPEMATEEGANVLESVKQLLNKVCTFIDEKSATL